MTRQARQAPIDGAMHFAHHTGKRLLSAGEFAQLADISPQKARRALARAEGGHTWNGHKLKVERHGRQLFLIAGSLPDKLWRKFVAREVADILPEPGIRDDEAHLAFQRLPRAARERARRKADIACYILKLREVLGEGASWAEIARGVRATFGPKGTSENSLKALFKAVQGGDPINFAPALAPNWRTTPRRAPCTDQAWAAFLAIIRDSHASYPLLHAWRDARDIAAGEGWDWPGYEVVLRRWRGLPKARREELRFGRELVLKGTIPVNRDRTTLRPMDQLSLDGRKVDNWVRFPDGIVCRPVMIVLCDVRSDKVVGWRLAKSETSEATRTLLIGTVRRHGVPKRIDTDNGSAFASSRFSGSNAHPYIKTEADRESRSFGACDVLNIDVEYHKPGNARAKPAEAIFSHLRHIDNGPRFKGAHTGNRPGDRPSAAVEPVSLEFAERVYGEAIAAFNTLPCRVQGANGRSRNEIFEQERGAPRIATEAQLRSASLEYDKRKVDQFGRLRIGNWSYGDENTRPILDRYIGQELWIGRDPENYEAPVVAYDTDQRLVCNDIPCMAAGAYRSREGERTARKLKRDRIKHLNKAAEADNALSSHGLAELLEKHRSAAPTDEGAASGDVVQMTPNLLRPARPDRDASDSAEIAKIRERELAAEAEDKAAGGA
jgi:putative transposase